MSFPSIDNNLSLYTHAYSCEPHYILASSGMSVGWPGIQLIQKKQNGRLIFPLNTEPTFKYTNNQRPPRKYNSKKSFYFTFYFFLSQKEKRLKNHTPSQSFQFLMFYAKWLVCGSEILNFQISYCIKIASASQG